MEDKKKYTEIVMRMLDNYADLWFKNELIEFMNNQNGVSSVDLLFQFSLFKDKLITHLIDNIKMDDLFSVNLIEHIVEVKYDEHLKGLISSMT